MSYSYALGEARAASASTETGSNIVAQHVSKSNSAAQNQKDSAEVKCKKASWWEAVQSVVQSYWKVDDNLSACFLAYSLQPH